MHSVTDDLLAGYEELPYESDPLHFTHPEALASAAYLAGMEPPPVEKCRVLEIGCGTGGNLLPMAHALPHSRFVGIDLSPRQIELGRAHASAIGLQNLELRAMDLMQIDRAFGEFDYIVCHGVYSWCPPPVQDRILQISSENLAPNGVAYVSYNTYPGWHRGGMLREMLRYHVAHLSDPRARVKEARSFAEFLARGLPKEAGLYGEMVREGAARLRPLPDMYVFHEYLESVNEPLYFHQFVARAAAHGLRYLCESSERTTTMDLAPEAQEALSRMARDALELEQYLDFVRNRTFRQSLWVHASHEIARSPSLERLRTLTMDALVKPDSEKPDVASEKSESFSGERKQLSTDIPLMKAILVSLFDAWPRRISLDELMTAVKTRLQVPPDDTELTEEVFVEFVHQCWSVNLLGLHVWTPQFSLVPSEKPRAGALARHLATTTKGPVPNLCHRGVDDLTAFDRALLALSDGTRDREGLVEGLMQAAARGDFILERGGRPVPAAELRPLLIEALEPSLSRLARHAFFE